MSRKLAALVLTCLLYAFAFGQGSMVKRGPRQQVNIDALPESSFYPGQLHIKLKAGFDAQLSAASVGNNRNLFGIPVLDALLKSFRIAGTKKSFDQVLKSNAKSNLHVAWDLQRWYTIQLPKETNLKAAARQLRLLSSIIEVAEPSYVRTLYEGADPALLWTPADSAYNQQWNFNHTAQQGATSPAGIDADIDLPEAWDLEKGKSNVIIAVLDGGADTTHPDLRPNLWIGSNGERFGYNWYAGSNFLQASSHGTHVCGTIAAVNNNAIGISGIAGGNGNTASGVRIMSMQVFSSSSAYAGDEATANAFVYSADHGAAIAQCSWGGGAFSSLLTEAIDYFIMNGGGNVLNGGLVVFSAGNSGNEVESFPGNYPPVLCVTATNYDDKKSWYSVYGSWVDICAPGGETTGSSGGGLMNGGRKGILSTLPGSGSTVNYGWLQGTSMACPHVSGVAALCVSKAAGNLSNDQLRSILLSTTDDIYPQNSAYTGKLGAGRVNAFKAVQSAALLVANAVDTVKSFTVSQSCGLATFNWAKNLAGNAVMIAASDTLLFGSPAGNLQAGNILPGGGTIIYKGGGNTTTNSLKLNQRRYYRIWSVSGTSYSFHKTVSAIYSTAVSLLSAEDGAGCYVNLSWNDALDCTSDSVILLAGNKPFTGEPSGILAVDDFISNGVKVIYKGKENSFNYASTFDSTIYFQKWSFNNNHLYSNPDEAGIISVSKQNTIQDLSAKPLSNTSVKITWTTNTGETCFNGDTYLLAYSTDKQFGTPAGTYLQGANIEGGGTVVYIGTDPEFLQLNLTENTNYCFKVFKVANGSNYSFGKSVCVRTLCANNGIIPAFTDTFDGEDLSDPDICNWEVTDNTTRSNTLKIVNSTTNPFVSPAQGSGMLRFNAYNIPVGETVRLSSTVIKKIAGKELDLLFRWYQDSSNYTSNTYAGEGVLVQWSTDKTNWQNLEFYPRVPKKGLTGWSYKQLTLPAAATQKELVYVSLLFTSTFGNNCYLDNFKIRYSSFKASDGITKLAACESTDSATLWTNYYDSSGNRLLSVKKNGQDIGKAGQQNFVVAVGGSAAAVAIPTNNNYVSNPGGWLSMNRFYTFKPLIEPAKNVVIRFYYFTNDYTALASAANLLLLPPFESMKHTNMYGWKITTGNANYNTDPAGSHVSIPGGTVYNANGYNQYVNTPQADTTTWLYKDFGGNVHAMEYLVRSSGSGSLGIGSINGRGAFKIITYTFNGNGNWSNSANWQDGNKPPATLPATGRIVINPTGSGECVLDIKQTLTAGAELLVNPSKKFRINSNLQLKR